MEATRPYWLTEEMGGYDQVSQKSSDGKLYSNGGNYLPENTQVVTPGDGGEGEEEEDRGGGGGSVWLLDLPVIRRSSNAFAPDSQISLLEVSPTCNDSETSRVFTVDDDREGEGGGGGGETCPNSPLKLSIPIVPISSSSSSSTSVFEFESLSVEFSTINLPPFPLLIPQHLLPPLPSPSSPLRDAANPLTVESLEEQLPKLLSSSNSIERQVGDLDEGLVEFIGACDTVEEEDDLTMKDDFEQEGLLSLSLTPTAASPSPLIDDNSLLLLDLEQNSPIDDDDRKLFLFDRSESSSPTRFSKEKTSEFRLPNLPPPPRRERRSRIKTFSPSSRNDSTPRTLTLPKSYSRSHSRSRSRRSLSPPVPLKQHPPYPFLLSSSSSSSSTTNSKSKSQSPSLRSRRRRRRRNSSRSSSSIKSQDTSPAKRKRTESEAEEEEEEEENEDRRETRGGGGVGGIVWVYEKGLESFEKEREVRNRPSPVKKRENKV
ncbi:hypothetical protein JCM3765_002357 [Sporobolomyces pararoseus]